MLSVPLDEVRIQPRADDPSSIGEAERRGTPAGRGTDRLGH